MNKISGVVITFNEQNKIKDCIESMYNIVDEIVILDSYSSDKTIEIASQYDKVKIYQHTFDSFTNQKNRAVSYSTYEYILSLDADERLSKNLQQELLSLKNELHYYDAYKIKIMSFIKNKPIMHSSWYPGYKIRLWNKNKGLWVGQNIHETVEMKEEAKIYKCKSDIIHFSYDSFEHFVNKNLTYAKLKALDKIEKKQKYSFLKMIFKPIVKFIIVYFIKLGILDGFYGFLIACISAYSDFYIQVLLKDYNKISNVRPPSYLQF